MTVQYKHTDFLLQRHQLPADKIIAAKHEGLAIGELYVRALHISPLFTMPQADLMTHLPI